MNNKRYLALTQQIEAFLGLPYRWGGDDAINGFDCSGLCIELLQSVGVLPPGFDATAQGLRAKFPAVHQGGGAFGDLVFFGSDLKQATHVGFCIGEGLMVEAGGGGSKTTSREAAAEQNAYVRIRPVSNRKDLLGYGRPEYPA